LVRIQQKFGKVIAAFRMGLLTTCVANCAKQLLAFQHDAHTADSTAEYDVLFWVVVGLVVFFFFAAAAADRR
jgi:ABC-type Na+ efflux pump permease subunit